MNYDILLSRAGERMQQSAIRQMGTVAAENPEIISFAPGYPAPDTFAWGEFREIARDILSGQDGSVLQYGPTRGLKPLREWTVNLLADREIRAVDEEVLVTTGSQQGLDLVGRVLLDPGDVVLVELPSYTGAITAFRNAQATLIGVHQEADGLSIDDLESTTTRLEREGRRVKFLYVVPNFQNPTGLLIGLEKRRRLLEWAARHELLIVEDDPYGDLYFEDSAGPTDTRPIKADDRDGRVIYLSSFSKTLAPALRTAFMVSPLPLAPRFETAKQTLDLCTSNLNQRMVYEACRRGLLARQVPLLRHTYQRKRDVMETVLKATLGERVTWHSPRGGFFLWVTLPSHLDAGRLLLDAIKRQVIYVAGQAFFVDGSGSNTLRLAFSFVPDEQIIDGMNRVAGVIRSALSAQSTPTSPVSA